VGETTGLLHTRDGCAAIRNRGSAAANLAGLRERANANGPWPTLHIQRLKLTQRVGGIARSPSSGRTDHEPAARLKGAPDNMEHGRKRPPHFQQHPIRMGGQQMEVVGAWPLPEYGDSRSQAPTVARSKSIASGPAPGVHRVGRSSTVPISRARAPVPPPTIPEPLSRPGDADARQQHHPQLHGSGTGSPGVLRRRHQVGLGSQIPGKSQAPEPAPAATP